MKTINEKATQAVSGAGGSISVGNNNTGINTGDFHQSPSGFTNTETTINMSVPITGVIAVTTPKPIVY